MLRIELTEQQASALAEVLHTTIAELGMEIAATERQSFRDQLKARRLVLRQVLTEVERDRPKVEAV